MPRQPFQAKAKPAIARPPVLIILVTHLFLNRLYLHNLLSIFFAVTKIVQIERIKKQLVDFFVPKCSLSCLKDSANPELGSEPGHRFCQ